MSDDIESAVLRAAQDALALGEDEVTRDATLMGDLEAESIDLLDILFRIEKATGVKIEAADLSTHIQGGIPDEEFGAGGVVSEKGLEQLKRVMPQIALDEFAGKLEPEQVITLFTVGNLVELVRSRAGAAA